MKTILSIVLTTVGLSCGYTVVQRPPQPETPPLPDLIIAEVRWQAGWVDHTHDIIADGVPPDSPTPAMFFQLDLINIGDVPFEGRPSIAWSAGESDIAWGAYSESIVPTPATILLTPHDTTTLSIVIEKESHAFPARVRFLVVTQQVMPQSKRLFNHQEAVSEQILNNNYFDLVRE